MKLSYIIDFADCFITCCCELIEKDRLDVDIYIGMICRIFFFILAIAIRDLNTYTWGEFIFQIIAWLFYHVYIIFYEMPYFVTGKSKTKTREQTYKLMDFFQQLIGIIYLLLNRETIYDLLLLILFICNICFTFLQTIYQGCQKEKLADYDSKGGIKNISLGIFIGSISVIIYLFHINSKYEQEISASSTLKVYLYITILGEIAAALFSFFICCLPYEKHTFSEDCSKWILGILYGINFGLFSLFYGFLVVLTIIIGFLNLCAEGCREKSEVHPTI